MQNVVEYTENNAARTLRPYAFRVFTRVHAKNFRSNGFNPYATVGCWFYLAVGAIFNRLPVQRT